MVVLNDDQQVEQHRRKYDEYCKRVLRCTPFLTRILRAYVPEFAEMDLADIAQCIGEVEVGTEPVGREIIPSLFVEGKDGEDADASEGRATFDLRLSPRIPNGEGVVRVEVNIEAQGKWNPGYSLLKRAVFYAGRMLSMQGDNVLPHSEYDKLRKVYSIWVCTNPKAGYRHRVARISLAQDDLLGHAPFDRTDFDLIDIVMVCLGEDPEVEEDEMVDLLNLLFKQPQSVRSIHETLQNKYGIILSEKENEEVDTMCNMSEYAIEYGIEQGAERTTVSNIRKLVEKGIMTIDQALDALDVSQDDRPRYRELALAGGGA